MSGAEVIGIISGTIAIVDASRRLYDAIDDASGLPQSFRDVAVHLPLVLETLATALAGVAEEPQRNDGDDGDDDDDNAAAALTGVLESCRAKATALHQLLQAVTPAAGASPIRRYLKALKTIPNADKVEKLMGGILADLQVVAGSRAIKATSRAHMQRLTAGGALSLHNAGPGVQMFHSGRGNQNMASGRGIQINGPSTGPFFFGRAGAGEEALRAPPAP